MKIISYSRIDYCVNLFNNTVTKDFVKKNYMAHFMVVLSRLADFSIDKFENEYAGGEKILVFCR